MKGVTCNIADRITDIHFEIDEVIVRVENPQLSIKRPLGLLIDEGKKVFGIRMPLHNVLRVTLTNGEVYALDLTGPQFGWHGSTVMPWSAFSKNRVDIVKEVRHFGKTARIIKEEAQVAGVAQVNMHDINEQMAIRLDHCLKHWQKDNVSLKAMLRCSEEEFRPKQDSMFEHVEARMLEVRAFALKTGFFDILTGKPQKRGP